MSYFPSMHLLEKLVKNYIDTQKILLYLSTFDFWSNGHLQGSSVKNRSVVSRALLQDPAGKANVYHLFDGKIKATLVKVWAVRKRHYNFYFCVSSTVPPSFTHHCSTMFEKDRLIFSFPYGKWVGPVKNSLNLSGRI